MIDEKKLLEDLFQKIPQQFQGNEQIMDWFCKLIESQEKIKEWVPCKIKLPEKRDNYLCTMESEEGSRFRMIGHYNMPGWTEDNKMHQTIAWQPLPDLYSEPITN